MPKCKHCPIVRECMKNPIITEQPTKWYKTGKKAGQVKETTKVRVCPLLVLIDSMKIRGKRDETAKTSS